MLPTILTELSITDMSNITGGNTDQQAGPGNGLPALPPVKLDETPDLAKEMTAPLLTSARSRAFAWPAAW